MHPEGNQHASCVFNSPCMMHCMGFLWEWKASTLVVLCTSHRHRPRLHAANTIDVFCRKVVRSVLHVLPHALLQREPACLLPGFSSPVGSFSVQRTLIARRHGVIHLCARNSGRD